MFAGLAAMAGTCVLLHEQMDALLLAGLFLRGGAIGLLTLQAMTAALESAQRWVCSGRDGRCLRFAAARERMISA